MDGGPRRMHSHGGPWEREGLGPWEREESLNLQFRFIRIGALPLTCVTESATILPARCGSENNLKKSFTNLDVKD